MLYGTFSLQYDHREFYSIKKHTTQCVTTNPTCFCLKFKLFPPASTCFRIIPTFFLQYFVTDNVTQLTQNEHPN